MAIRRLVAAYLNCTVQYSTVYIVPVLYTGRVSSAFHCVNFNIKYKYQDVRSLNKDWIECRRWITISLCDEDNILVHTSRRWQRTVERLYNCYLLFNPAIIIIMIIIIPKAKRYMRVSVVKKANSNRTKVAVWR